MPNRIIKESICDSEKISSLTDFEFRLWVGLITQVDDAGRGDARPAYIKGHVFAFRERTTAKDIDAALHALAAKGCVTLYTVGGRPYFLFPNWAKHQRIRDCKPKYPGIDESDNLPQSAASCGELPQSAALIQSNQNPNPNRNPNHLCAELPNDSTSAPADCAQIPLNDGTEFSLTAKQLDELVGLYPAVDVRQELRNMRGWCMSNPSKRKTKGGVMRFITGWLSREQDKGGRSSNASSPQKTGQFLPQKDFNPSLERIEKSQDWLDKFLAEQEQLKCQKG